MKNQAISTLVLILDLAFQFSGAIEHTCIRRVAAIRAVRRARMLHCFTVWSLFITRLYIGKVIRGLSNTIVFLVLSPFSTDHLTVTLLRCRYAIVSGTFRS